MSEFERIFGEDYAVVHRNGSVTVALPDRGDVQGGRGSALWSVTARYAAVMCGISLLVWSRESGRGSHPHGSGSASHLWLIPVITLAGGVLVTACAAASRLTVRDRRSVCSAWVAVTVLSVPVAGLLRPGSVLGTAVVGAWLLVAFLVTVAVLAHGRRGHSTR